MKIKNIFLNFIILLLIISLSTILGLVFTGLNFSETNIVIIYLLGVLLTARFTKGYTYGILSTIISILCYNYFFTKPYYTFAVYDPGYLITFAIMLITSFVTSALTTKGKLLTIEAEEASKENEILYKLSSKLSDATDIESILKITVESVSSLFQVNTGCIYLGKESSPIYFQQVNNNQIYRHIENPKDLFLKFTNLRTEYLEDNDEYYFPVNGRENLLAIIKISKEVNDIVFNQKKRLLHSIIENISVSIDRIEITLERIRDQEKIQREQDRSNLLRAISHDIRTPLSGIMGTSEILMDKTINDNESHKMIVSIYQDASWLKSLVENILSLTRLQDGKFLLHKELEVLEEVVSCSVSHIEHCFPNRNIKVNISNDFSLVPMDAKLIGQVVTNLLDNAIKHTSPSDNITVTVKYDKDIAIVSVVDEGEGISNKDIDNIFNLFYTTNGKFTDSKSGIGLGLAICETVVKAHNGDIVGRNRTDGKKGAEFTFKLPIKEDTYSEQ